jgi:HK97 gp10 family phage protein
MTSRTHALSLLLPVVHFQKHSVTGIFSMPIVIEGLKELSDRLANMAPRSAKRYLKKAGAAGAEIVLAEMEQTVPVDVGYLEEVLGYDISFEGSDDATTMTVDIGPYKQAFWGSFQEFGTSTQPGQHWMGRAWEATRDKVLDVMATELTGMLMDLENRG